MKKPRLNPLTLIFFLLAGAVLVRHTDAQERITLGLTTRNGTTSLPFGGLAVHTQKIKEKPEEIVKMIKALLKATDYIRTRKNDILGILEANWESKKPTYGKAFTGTWWDCSARMGWPRMKP